MRYVWNEVRPRTDQIERKHVTTSIKDPQESFIAKKDAQNRPEKGKKELTFDKTAFFLAVFVDDFFRVEDQVSNRS